MVLGDIRKYYISTYQELPICDSIAKLVSKKLKQQNRKHYIFNELARIQILSFQDQSINPIVQLEELYEKENLEKDNILHGYYYNVYGGVLFQYAKPREAREKYRKAVNIFYNTTDSSGLKGNLINMGNTFIDLEKIDSGLYYYNQALVLEKKGIKIFSSSLKCNIGRAYQQKGMLDSAVYHYKEVIQIFRDENNIDNLVTVLMNIGATYQVGNQTDSALHYLKEANQLALKINLPHAVKQTYVQMALCYKAQHNYEEALIYFFRYDSVVHFLNSANLDQKIGERKLSQEKEIHIAKQALISEKLNTQKRVTTYLILTSLLSLIILILFLFFIIKLRSKNKMLTQSKLSKARQDIRTFVLREEQVLDKDLIDKLIKVFENEKIYLDSKLSLEKLAKKLDSNRTYISKTINAYYKIPYNDLVNQYRIDEACVLLTSKKYLHYSIEGIAQTVGYHNLSSFNSAFKRLTGTTPSKFKENI